MADDELYNTARMHIQSRHKKKARPHASMA
jgi:hypothetical protein